MVITIRNTDDFIRALRENPEFRDAARRELLTEDLLELPGEFREFRSGVEEFMSSSEEFRSGVEEFRASAERRFDTLTNRVDDLRGYALEAKMPSRLRQRLGRELGLSRVRAIWMGEHSVQPQSRAERFSDSVEQAFDEGHLTDDEAGRLLDTDLIARGSRISDGATVYIAVETSGVIGISDISRARESADIMARLYAAPAIPAVYGFNIAREQTDQARSDPNAGLEEVHIFTEPESF